MRGASGILAVLLIGVVSATATAPAFGQGADVLPDLDQAVPTKLSVKRFHRAGRTTFRLGFASGAANVGAGPLTLLGTRRSVATPFLDVNQIVEQAAGPARVVRGVGRMSYVVHPDHRHWHLLGFERYEIRAAGADDAPLRRDRKTGFCLGDRFAVHNARALRGFRSTPQQADECGLGAPRLLGLLTGISIGWVDEYLPHVEGQFVDVTGLPAGRYVLVHSLNTNGRIVERDYSNNASSVLFSLTWPRGAKALPRLRVVRSCPDSGRCPTPPRRST